MPFGIPPELAFSFAGIPKRLLSSQLRPNGIALLTA
jgi:hypothetical protein